MTITVVVADDDPLVRSGIRMLLCVDDIEIVGEADNGRTAIELVRRLRPSVVLMDARMPGTDGFAATRELTADPPDGAGAALTRVVVLTTFGNDEAVVAALRSGASGFVLKHEAPRDLVTALRRVDEGDVWIDPAVTRGLVDLLRRPADGISLSEHELRSVLTPREIEVLHLVAEGLSNNEIAAHLVLSVATVKTHVARVITKTGCRQRAEAVALAYRSGLVSITQPAHGSRFGRS